MFCGMKSYNTFCLSAFMQPYSRQILPLIYPPCDDTLLEVGPEIHCSGVLSRYICYGNHTAGSKPI